MNHKPYNYGVVIGRFSPPHLGHKELIDTALELCDKVIILLGSAHKPRTIKNPFTTKERQLMIESMYDSTITPRLLFLPLSDYEYNDQKWVMQVQNRVDEAIEMDGGDPDTSNIVIVGNNKDESSYYLKMFPQWPDISTELVGGAKGDNNLVLNATEIRQILFETETNRSTEKISKLVYPSVLKYIDDFKHTEVFGKLALEHNYIRKYKESWAKAPYPVTFVTTDAIVVQSGHILLIERKAEPGKGLLAMPGGFLNQQERIEDGMIRELREETKLKVPEPLLQIDGRKEVLLIKDLLTLWQSNGDKINLPCTTYRRG